MGAIQYQTLLMALCWLWFVQSGAGDSSCSGSACQESQVLCRAQAQSGEHRQLDAIVSLIYTSQFTALTTIHCVCIIIQTEMKEKCIGLLGRNREIVQRLEERKL